MKPPHRYLGAGLTGGSVRWRCICFFPNSESWDRRWTGSAGKLAWTLAATVAGGYLCGRGLGIIVAAGMRLPLLGATMAQLAAGLLFYRPRGWGRLP